MSRWAVLCCLPLLATCSQPPVLLTVEREDAQVPVSLLLCSGSCQSHAIFQSDEKVRTVGLYMSGPRRVGVQLLHGAGDVPACEGFIVDFPGPGQALEAKLLVPAQTSQPVTCSGSACSLVAACDPSGCSSTTCPDGCCDNGWCRLSSSTTCGTVGAACQSCTGSQAECVAGVCIAAPSGCVSSNGSCAGGKSCCSETESCQDGTCLTCKDADTSCTSSEECCAGGTCHSSVGRCVAASCRADESSCDIDADCCNLNCESSSGSSKLCKPN